MGSSLPPAELARRDSALLRKLSTYFLLRRWEFWRSRGSVFAKKHSPDAGLEAPDAEPVRPVYRLPGSARVKHRTQAPDAGCSIRCSESGVHAVLQTSLGMSPVSTRRSGAQRPVTPSICIPP